MGCKQSHKADQARKTDNRGNHQRRDQQNDQPQNAHIHTQHSGLSFFRGEQDHLPVQQEQDCHANHAQDQIAADGINADTVQAAHDPVFDGSQFPLRIGGEFQRHQGSLRQGMDGDAGEDDGAVFAALIQTGKGQSEDHCQQRTGERRYRYRRSP